MGDVYVGLLAKATEALAQNALVINELQAVLAKKSEAEEVGRAILADGKWYTVAEAAKELAIDLGEGKRLGQNQLYAFLRTTHMVLRRRDPSSRWLYHHPYQAEVDAGRMKLEDRPTSRETEDGHRVVHRRTIISPAGIAYLRKRILEEIQEGMIDELISG